MRLRKNANTILSFRANKFAHEGFTLMQLDIANAFNSVPYEAIMYELRRNRVNGIFRNYCDNFLKTRYCEFSNGIKAGTP